MTEEVTDRCRALAKVRRSNGYGSGKGKSIRCRRHDSVTETPILRRPESRAGEGALEGAAEGGDKAPERRGR